MGGKAPSSPPPTPPGETAKADYGAEVATAGFGLQHGTPNQFSPGGSVTFDKYALPDQSLGNGQTVPGGQGVSGVHTSFSPEFQPIFNRLSSSGASLANQLPNSGFNPNIQAKNQGLIGTLANTAQARAHAAPTTPWAPNIDSAAYRQSFVDQGLRDVVPEWNRQDDQFKVTMSERGIPIGAEIDRNERDRVGEQRGTYVRGLTDQATQASAANDQAQFGRQLTQRQNQVSETGQAQGDLIAAQQYDDTSGMQQFGQQLAQHQVPFSDFSNFYNAVQGMQAGLQGRDAPLIAANVTAPDVAGITARYDQANQQRAAAQAQSQNSAMGLLGSLGGGLLGLFSDERLKEDIEKVGQTDDGQNIYTYQYKGDPSETTHMGLLAQEVEKKHPEAVGEVGGFKTVRYDLATKDAAMSDGPKVVSLAKLLRHRAA